MRWAYACGVGIPGLWGEMKRDSNGVPLLENT